MSIRNKSLAVIFSIVTSFAAGPAFAERPPFESWLAQVKQEALNEGIRPAVVNDALDGVTPDQKVIELDKPKNQPEMSESFAAYSSKRVNAERIRRGQEMLRTHYNELKRIGDRYGVEPQYIVALWGMETDYGRITGKSDIIRSLVTLAWDGRDGTSPKRAAFFRKELLAALKIINDGHFTRSQMLGSWAGAFGHVQFMPTSFLRLARDGNGDGRIDIRGNLSDAFASAANYLAQSGWQSDQRWGRRVTLPPGFSTSHIGADTRKSLAQWRALGVKQADGSPLPDVPGMTASVIAQDGPSGQVYLVYNNFHTIKKWNNSNNFALSVGILADAIARATPSQ